MYFAYVSVFWIGEAPLNDYTRSEWVGFAICWGAQLLGLLLNFSWAKLIVGQLMRMVKGGKATTRTRDKKSE